MLKIKESHLKLDPRVKVFTYEGKKEGPRVFIMAGIHGGENSGIQVAFELKEYLEKMKDLRGLVTLIPLVNIDGFAAQTRDNPIDGKNINTAGGGASTKKTQSDKIAEELIDLCNQHDYALDLHSGSIAEYLQHVYVTKLENLQLGRSFGFQYVVGNGFSKNYSSEEGGSRGRKTILSRSNPISFCVELGGGMTINYDDTQRGVSGVLSFLSEVGITGKGFKVESTSENQVFGAQRHDVAVRISVPEAGNIFYKVSLGDSVNKDQMLAEIISIDSSGVTRVYSPCEGRVAGICILARVDKGLVKSLGKWPPLVWLMPKDNRSLKGRK